MHSENISPDAESSGELVPEEKGIWSADRDEAKIDPNEISLRAARR